MAQETITYSCTANFSEDSGVDQDLTKSEITECIELNYDIQNNVLQENDQCIDCDDVEIIWISVSIDCMEDRSSVEYTVTALVELEEESEEETEY